MGMRNLTPFVFQADIMNGVDPAPEDITLEDGFFTEAQGEGLLLQPAGGRLADHFHQEDGGVSPCARRRGLRDDAHARVRLPDLDARRGGGHPGCGGGRDLDRAPVTDDHPVLEVDHIGVSFSGRRILDDVSFAIRNGEFTGLIGSNGVGKTTLLRIILGLQPADSGQVRVLGAPLSSRNRSLGYVPQKVVLDPDVPVRARDLVALGLDAQRYGFGRRTREQRDLVERMLHDVDAERFADSRVGSLSGGEQQRVLIAHALICRPKLLLLDEPLANLDPKSVTGDRGAAAPGVQRARGGDPPLGARDERPPPGHGPHRLRHRRAGRQRDHRGGRALRRPEHAVRAPRRCPHAPWPGTGRVGARRRNGRIPDHPALTVT